MTGVSKMLTPIQQITPLIPSRDPEQAEQIWNALTHFGYTPQDLVTGKIRVGLILDLAQSIRSEK